MKSHILRNSLNNYVVSSRVRLARNIDGFLFPSARGFFETEQAHRLLETAAKPMIENGFTLHRLSEKTDVEILQMMESHLISRELIRKREASAVLLDEKKQTAIMINEEDHLRLQVILPGLELDRAYQKVAEADDIISRSLPLVYHDRLGFITSCPTNLGTGMRASVMMFLPALSKTGAISEIERSVSNLKLTLRGVFGEGSEPKGFMYQLSNQHTLGLSEPEIISGIQSYIGEIAHREEELREKLFEFDKVELKDKILRSWGILTNCFKISGAECTECLSYVKLGLGLGVLKLSRPELIDSLLTTCRPGNLSMLKNPKATEAERDILRAEHLRETLG
jgi:protein arginine kinase